MVMRILIGLLIALMLAGCAEPVNQSGKRYLFNTERCADVAPKGSPEYADCEKRLAHEDAERMYNLNNNGMKPGWVVLRGVI
jgi:hypothetical protein